MTGALDCTLSEFHVMGLPSLRVFGHAPHAPPHSVFIFPGCTCG